ncbi:MAG: PKD domain-containing protein [Bacteroidia bacterium]
MNNHVAFSSTAWPNPSYILFANAQWNRYLSTHGYSTGPVSIQKNSHLWIGDMPDSHIGTFDTLATVLNRFYMPNTLLTQIIADTNDHVYVVYNNNSGQGFGVVRFGATYVPDWHKYYPGENAQDAMWGIDQRLYVTTQTKVTVISQSGTRLKDLNLTGSKFTVFQDHGLAIFSMASDSVRVVRTDSNMVLRWAKKFKPAASIWGLPITVIAANGVASTNNNELLVVATGRVTLQSTMNCIYPYTEEVHLILLDDVGTVVGNRRHPGTNTWNTTQTTVTGTPFGDALISYDYHTCILGANIQDRYLSVITPHFLHQTCTGVAPTVTSTSFTPSGLPTVGPLGATSVPTATLQSDNFNFGYYADPVAGSVTCVLPCVSLTATALGGGQVAFNDDAHGFHTIHYDFGDGTTGTTNDPVHNYPPYGTWPVTVIVMNDCGADTATYMIHACPSAIVSGPNEVCLGATANYTVTNGLNPAGLSWLVDGVPMGTGSSFSWSPTTVGNHTLSTVYALSPCQDTVSMTVSVNTGLPVAGFTFVVSAPQQLTFTNTSTNGVSYSWNFGDGTTSTATNPVKTYTQAFANNGNFTICLTATNGCGSNTYCYNFNCPIPNSSFSISATNGLTATISNSATNGTLSWAFGDGTTGTGVVTSHTYPATGTYTLCQTVTNACASHTTCQQVMVSNSSTASYRTFFDVNGYHLNVNAIAAQANGDVLVASSNTTPLSALLSLDSTGAIRSLRMWNSNSSNIADLQPLNNGNFAFFGSTNNGATSMDMTWGELDKFGNVVQGKSMPLSNQQNSSRAFKTPNGYIFIAESGGNPSFYARLDQSLQLQYMRACSTKTWGGLEAPDGSIWLIQKPTTNNTVLEIVHLNNLGVGIAKYTSSFQFAGTSASITDGSMDFKMDCNGMIYGIVRINDLIAGNNINKLGIFRFNTTNGAIVARTYRVGGNSNANNPYHEPIVNSLTKYPNGHFIGWGSLRKSTSIATAPNYEKFAVDIDPTTFSVSISSFGTGGTNEAERVWDACNAGPGQCYTLSNTGIAVAQKLEVHRHGAITDCQLPASTLAPQIVLEYTNTTATFSNATLPSSAVTTLPTNWSPTFTTNPGSSLLQCAGACPSGLVAAFTHSVSGNTLTLTSTSTPGAMLQWSIQGQSCLANATTGPTTLSVSLPCGSYNVTLTAADQCGSKSTTQTIMMPTQLPLSLGPDQSVCPGVSTTFTANPGFSSYLWNTGSNNSSITVSTPGTYAVTVTDGSGCQGADTVSLANFAAPNLFLGNDTSFCVDTTWTLSGPTGASSYLWSTGATTQSIQADTTGSYSLTVIDTNGCTLADTIQLQLDADCVWPGDADHDGLANNADLLAVAFSMAYTGATRPNATTTWYGQRCANWSGNLPLGANFKHQDCNGNGTVEVSDTMAIHQNYGFTHNKAGGLLTGVPVWIEPEQDSFPVGDTVFFRVHWGDAVQPVVSGQGVAFSLHIDPTHVTPGTLYGRYQTSFLGNGVPDLLSLTVPFPASGDVHHAVSRQDHSGRSGYGAVLRMGFLPDQVIPLTTTLGYIPVHVGGIVAVDQNFVAISSTGIDDSILVYDPVNGLHGDQPLLNCTVFPVPASDIAYLDFGIQIDATVAAELTDMHGRMVSRIHSASFLPSGRHRFAIPTDRISEGVYMVRLRVNGAVRVMKLVVAR